MHLKISAVYRSGLAIIIASCLIETLIVFTGLASSSAKKFPELAIMLIPGHAEALVALAGRLPEPKQSASAGLRSPALASGQENTRSTAIATSQTIPPNVDALVVPDFAMPLNRVKELALKALAVEPLNAEAIRIIAQALYKMGSRDEATIVMKMAARRTSHDLAVQLWELTRAEKQGDFLQALNTLELMYRISIDIRPQLMSAFGMVADHVTGRELIVTRLKEMPPWRSQFLGTYHRTTSNDENPLKIFLALNEAGETIAPGFLVPYMENLVEKKKFDQAYYAWLQILPQETLKSMSLIANGDFESEPVGGPFDWTMPKEQSFRTDIVSGEDSAASRHLFLRFFGERVQQILAQQVLMLPPGKYRLKGSFQVHDLANFRGLVWRIVCLSSKLPNVTQSQPMHGNVRKWTEFQSDFQIPDEECPAQRLYLTIDARNSVETLISGRALYDNLRIETR